MKIQRNHCIATMTEAPQQPLSLVPPCPSGQFQLIFNQQSQAHDALLTFVVSLALARADRNQIKFTE